MQNTMLDTVVSSNSQELSNASSAIKLFENPLFKARVIMRCSEPWFVAKDVADSIEHSNVTKMCELCRDKDKVTITDSKEIGVINESLRTQQTFSKNAPHITLISESGLYRILAKCNLPKCEPFESWVFDEVLPSIRKTGGYGIRTVDDMINDPDTAIRLLTQLKIMRLQNKQLEMERDEAIRTKCHFVEGRDAKVCGELGGLRTQNEALRKQIGDSKTYKAATAISWLPDYFDMSNRGLYGSLAAKLKKVEAEMPHDFAHIDIQDSRWGKVKAYHVAVIERLHEMVQADENLMKKYRKVASV